MSNIYIQYPSGSTSAVPTYANFASLPASADDGAVAVTLDTDSIYVFNAATNSWKLVGSGSSTVVQAGSLDGGGASPNGVVVGSNTIYMQSATLVNPGLVSSAAQSFAGVKTFGSAPNLSSLSASLPLQLDGSKNIIAQAINLSGTGVVGSISLTSQVVGNLPLSQTSGSISLTAQVSGVLPVANGGSTGSNTGDLSVGAFSGTSVNGLTISSASQIITLNTASNTSPGGVSTAIQIFGGAKTFVTSIASKLVVVGSVSQQSTAGGSSYTINWPSSQGSSSSTTLINDGAGNLSWSAFSGSNTGDLSVGTFGGTSLNGITISSNSQVITLNAAAANIPGALSTSAQNITGAKNFITSLSARIATIGSVTHDSVVGGNQYTLKWPASQGSSSWTFSNDGTGNLSWVSSLTNPMTALGDLIVGSSSGTPVRFIGNTSNSISYLTQTGTGAASNFPRWTVWKAPTAQVFLSGSGTYTTPTSAVYLKVRILGAGGGGAGSGTATTGGAGAVGSSSTFGSILVAAGGTGGGATAGGASASGIGGTATINAGAVTLVSLKGGDGGSGQFNSTSGDYQSGGYGGVTPFGGGGVGNSTLAGGNAVSNTGCGGGGGGNSANVLVTAGAGGGAGAYIEVFIAAPSASYTYTIGSGGGGGAAGTSGFAGGGGASGQVIVEEYYQ